MKKYIIGLLGILIISGGLFFGWWKMNKEESFERKNKVTLTGQLEDKDGKLLSNQEIKLSYKKEELSVKTDKSGYFYTHIEKNKEYDISSNEVEGVVSATDDDKINTTMKKGTYFSGKKIETEDSTTVLRNKAIELDPDNFIYEVSSDYGTVTIFSGKDKNEELDFLIGDLIAIPAQVDYISGLGLKVIDIEKESDNYVLTTEQAAVEDILKSFETKKDGYEMDVKEAYFELSDEVQLLDETQQEMAWTKPTLERSIGKSLKTDKVSVKYPSDEYRKLNKKKRSHKPQDDLSFEMDNKIKGTILLNINIDFDSLENATVLASNKIELETNIKLKIKKDIYGGTDKIEIIELKLPPVGPYVSTNLPIYAKIGAAGELSLENKIVLPTIESEFGIKQGQSVNPSPNVSNEKVTLVDYLKKIEDISTESKKSVEVYLGVGFGIKLNALTRIPIVELDVFAGPSGKLDIIEQLSDKTSLIKYEVTLLKFSFEIDPHIFGPILKAVLPKQQVEGKRSKVEKFKVSEGIELYSKSLDEKSGSWLMIGDYNKLLSAMDKAENLVKTEEPIDSPEYKKLVNLVEGKDKMNKGLTFKEMKVELEKKIPKVLMTEDNHPLFTTQKAINEFTQDIEKLLSIISQNIEETSKNSSKNFDELPQATQFVVINSLLDPRITNLMYEGPELFTDRGGVVEATYYEDTQHFSFLIHSGVGTGHPTIDWLIREDDVLLIQSLHRSSFDEYEKRIPESESAGSISKADLFELYQKHSEHYDRWGAGTTVKTEGTDPRTYLNEEEELKKRTTTTEISLPSVGTIQLKEM